MTYLKKWEDNSLLVFITLFVLLLILKFSSLSHPFYGDELVYLLKDFDGSSLGNYIPFSLNYISHSGHPPLLPLISFFIYKSGVPFIETIRILYLIFSACMLFGIWRLTSFLTSSTLHKLAPIILIITNPLFYTQSSMTIANILECSIITNSLYYFFKRDRNALLFLLIFGILARESLIGLILILFIFDPQKKKMLVNYLIPCVLLILFFLAEKSALGSWFNHPIAVQGMDHGNFTWSLSNFDSLYNSLRELAPPFIWLALLGSLTFLQKVEKSERKIFILLFATTLPYLVFFGLYSDSQGRDFLILLPVTFIWLTRVMETLFTIKILAVPFFITFLSLQLVQFQVVRDKNTPHLEVYFDSWNRMLEYLDKTPDVRNNLKADFPFNFIFKDKRYGHLNLYKPINEGKKSFLLTNSKLPKSPLHEVKIPSEDKASLFIYEIGE